jgi:hypothetical protein
MQLTTVFISAALALATGATAWAPDENGNQVANNIDFIGEGSSKCLGIRGQDSGRVLIVKCVEIVDEACSNYDTNEVVTSGPCKYWADENGTITEGSKCLNLKRLTDCPRTDHTL